MTTKPTATTTRRTTLAAAASGVLAAILPRDGDASPARLPEAEPHAAPRWTALDDVIDDLSAHLEVAVDAEWDAYKAALARVITLDPALLAEGFDHPVTLMDEAAVGLAVSAWARGLRVGAALAGA